MANPSMGARVVQGFVAMEPPTVTHNELVVGHLCATGGERR